MPNVDARGAHPERVIYLLKMFPRFSETFVVNEILGLQALGVDVEIVSLRKPIDGKFHAELSQVKRAAVYVPESLASEFAEFASAWGWALFDRPLRLVSTMVDALAGLSLDGFKRWAQAVWLCRRLADRPAQGIHCHFAEAAAHAAYFLNRLNGNPYTITAHAYDIFRRGRDFGLIGRMIERARGTVTVCDFNREYLLGKLGASVAPKLRRIYNGIDLEKFTPPGFAERRTDVVLSVSRLVEKKGIDVLIDAVAELRERGVQITCLIAGEGERGRALREQVERLSLGDRVQFLGSVSQDEVRRLQREATLLAAPCVEAADGNLDALPTSLIEALASGTPSITTTVTGVPEIVRDEMEGLHVPQHDAKATADAIARLLGDAPLRERLGKNARRRAEELFDRTRTVSELAAFLVECHAPHGGG